MACTSSDVSNNSGPLLQQILRIPTLLWSIQHGLGISHTVGLFSPPNLPFCQLLELVALVLRSHSWTRDFCSSILSMQLEKRQYAGTG